MKNNSQTGIIPGFTRPSANQFQKIKVAALAALVALGCSTISAQVTIDTVNVGYAGNAADSTGYGAVAYTYNIGKYEVTNSQYAGFLNAVAQTDTYGLYNANMAVTTSFPGGAIKRLGSSGSYAYTVNAGFENKAVYYVSFWDAARFTNWLNNGQGNASTETGAYTLTAGGIASNSITRNAGASWAIASENEWYKAAYYDPNKNNGTGGYWLYPTQSDSTANGQNGLVDVGHGGASAFGTYDQGGGVMEMNESISGIDRGLRGGAWDTDTLRYTDQRATHRTSFQATENAIFAWDVGFRVVDLTASAIPEPSTYAVALGGVVFGFAVFRRRQVER